MGIYRSLVSIRFTKNEATNTSRTAKYNTILSLRSKQTNFQHKNTVFYFSEYYYLNNKMYFYLLLIKTSAFHYGNKEICCN